MMGKVIWLVLIVGGGVASADDSAGDKDEPPIHFEVGLNTRHFNAVERGALTALRGEIRDPATESNTAMSVGLRFTVWLPRNFFTGAEAEVGKLDAFDHSNLAGAYGVLGVRGELGGLALSVEMAAGHRSIRYGEGYEEQGKLVAEPRVRASMWLGPRVTLGAALGTTLGGGDVWMAGVYIGVHSLVYGKDQP